MRGASDVRASRGSLQAYRAGSPPMPSEEGGQGVGQSGGRYAAESRQAATEGGQTIHRDMAQFRVAASDRGAGECRLRLDDDRLGAQPDRYGHDGADARGD